jgi:hypothetical protein
LQGRFQSDGKALLKSPALFIKMLTLENPSRLRATISRIITDIWCQIERNDKEGIEYSIKEYEKLRRTAQRCIPEDVQKFDRWFLKLPWQDCKYSEPKLEGIN